MMNNKLEMKPWMTGCWSPVLTTSTPNSGSESDLLQRDVINERRRKRLESNRESARRSRMKKRDHLDDLKAQLVQLRKNNRQTTAEIAVTTEHYVKIEAENTIMRAQLTELNHRLNSLNQIIRFAESYSSAAGGLVMEAGHSDAGGFGMETAPSAAGGFGMETGYSAAGGFGIETAPSAAGGLGMEIGQGGGVTGGSGGGGGYYDGVMNSLNLGHYNHTPNMTSAYASTGVGDVLNCW